MCHHRHVWPLLEDVYVTVYVYVFHESRVRLRKYDTGWYSSIKKYKTKTGIRFWKKKENNHNHPVAPLLLLVHIDWNFQGIHWVTRFFLCIFTQTGHEDIPRWGPCHGVQVQMDEAHVSLNVTIQTCDGASALINTHNCDQTCHKLKCCDYVDCVVKRAATVGEVPTNLRSRHPGLTSAGTVFYNLPIKNFDANPVNRATGHPRPVPC